MGDSGREQEREQERGQESVWIRSVIWKAVVVTVTEHSAGEKRAGLKACNQTTAATSACVVAIMEEDAVTDLLSGKCLVQLVVWCQKGELRSSPSPTGY